MNEVIEQSKFEGWAIVELMGHQREIGHVTTEAYGQAVMFRVDTPELPEREYELERPEYVAGVWWGAGSKVKRVASPARSRLVSPAALYSINPCTEAAAREALERSTPRPLIVIDGVGPPAELASGDDPPDDDGGCEFDEDDIPY